MTDIVELLRDLATYPQPSGRKQIITDSAAEIERLRAIRDELVLALEGVIRVADRKTDEFDAARTALAKAKGADT